MGLLFSSETDSLKDRSAVEVRDLDMSMISPPSWRVNHLVEPTRFESRSSVQTSDGNVEYLFNVLSHPARQIRINQNIPRISHRNPMPKGALVDWMLTEKYRLDTASQMTLRTEYLAFSSSAPDFLPDRQYIAFTNSSEMVSYFHPDRIITSPRLFKPFEGSYGNPMLTSY